MPGHSLLLFHSLLVIHIFVVAYPPNIDGPILVNLESQKDATE